MRNRKVRVGKSYKFVPVLFDKLNPPYNADPGDIVTVVNLPGCPRANTMGMCHINDAAGQFAGMVCTNSLQPIGNCEHSTKLSGQCVKCGEYPYTPKGAAVQPATGGLLVKRGSIL